MRYLFKHVLLRDVAYDIQLHSRLRELHRRAAEAIKTLYADELAPYYADLAYHYGQAEMREQERHYAFLAGKQAASEYANEAAVRFLSRALELTPESDREGWYRILAVRERIYDLQGYRDAQRKDLQMLLVLAKGENKAKMVLRQAHYAETVGNYTGAVSFAQRAVQLAQRYKNVQLEAAAYLRWGRGVWRQGQYKEAIPHFEQALTLARQCIHRHPEAPALGPGESSALCHPELAERAKRSDVILSEVEGAKRSDIILSEAEGAKRSDVILSEAEGAKRSDVILSEAEGAKRSDVILSEVEGAKRSDVILSEVEGAKRSDVILSEVEGSSDLGSLGDIEADSLRNIGNAYWSQGQLDKAMAYYHEALPRYRALHHKKGEGATLNNFAIVLLNQGEYVQAQHYSEQARQLKESIGDHIGAGIAYGTLGEIARQLGRYDEALAHHQRSLKLSQMAADSPGEGEAHIGLARLYHLKTQTATTDHWALAWEHVQQGLTIAHSLHDINLEADAQLCLGHISLGMKKLHEAHAAYSRAWELRKNLKQSHGAMEARAGLANVASAQEDWEQASAYVEAILPYVMSHPTLDGVTEPCLIYWTCYRILNAVQDTRAPEVLAIAYHHLQTKAAKIENTALRRSFLEDVVVRRYLIEAYQRHIDASAKRSR
jgi:tetratricopeptide (TPR) repeat protein